MPRLPVGLLTVLVPCSLPACAKPSPPAEQRPRVDAAPPTAGSSASSAANVPGDAGVEQAPRSMTVLASAEPTTAYCDGERMDSAGYAKTLVQPKTVTLPPAGASITDVVRAVLDATTDGMCHTVMSQLRYRLEAGTLHVPPVDGWAGISITMCSCRPALEANLPRIPGVARVVWDEQ